MKKEVLQKFVAALKNGNAYGFTNDGVIYEVFAFLYNLAEEPVDVVIAFTAECVFPINMCGLDVSKLSQVVELFDPVDSREVDVETVRAFLNDAGRLKLETLDSIQDVFDDFVALIEKTIAEIEALEPKEKVKGKGGSRKVSSSN